MPGQEVSPGRTVRSYRSAHALQPATPPALARKRSTINSTPGERYADDPATAFSPFRHSAEYASPAPVPSPFGVDMGYSMGVPMTPQFSPYAPNYHTAAAFSPAGGAWNPYSWAAPYLADPRYAQAAAASAYEQASFARQAGELDTPTKHYNSKHDELSEATGKHRQ